MNHKEVTYLHVRVFSGSRLAGAANRRCRQRENAIQRQETVHKVKRNRRDQAMITLPAQCKNEIPSRPHAFACLRFKYAKGEPDQRKGAKVQSRKEPATWLTSLLVLASIAATASSFSAST